MKTYKISDLFLLTFISLILFQCTTEDIAPAVKIKLNQNVLSEQNESIILTATLNGKATKEIKIPIIFGGNSTINSDYTISATDIIIKNGETTGSITITSKTDGLLEGPETIEIKIGITDDVIILNNVNLTATISDLDIDSDNDGVPDALDQCPTDAGVLANNGCPFVGFIVNEVLYDPADGIAGDANNDGTRDPLQDEFIEFFNSSATSIDISGYTISDASSIRHTFPTGTIVPSNKSIVVFGGGTPTGTFGGSMVQTATGGQLNMNNAGDTMTIKNTSNVTILTFVINGLSGNPDEAYTRNPDIYSTGFVRYSEISGNTSKQTPGTKVNGTSF